MYFSGILNTYFLMIIFSRWMAWGGVGWSRAR